MFDIMGDVISEASIWIGENRASQGESSAFRTMENRLLDIKIEEQRLGNAQNRPNDIPALEDSLEKVRHAAATEAFKLGIVKKSVTKQNIWMPSTVAQSKGSN